MTLISRNAWDNVVIVTRDGSEDQTWDGKVKNLVYDVGSMGWVAETQSGGGGGGGGGGDASAANQVIGNASLASIDSKTPLIDYAVRIDDVGGGVSYVGQAASGTPTSASGWKIKRVTDSGGDLVVLFADGNASFNKVWDDRLSLSYS